MENKEKLKVLIVFGYHQKEKFAVETGERLLREEPNAEIKIAEYEGRTDGGISTYYLRKFVEIFDPLISPIILHSDDDMDMDMAIIYNAKSKQEGRAAHRPLLEFCLDRSNHSSDLIVWGRFLTQNTNYSVIDIELNSRVGVEKAAALVKDFSRYLIRLYLDRKIKL